MDFLREIVGGPKNRYKRNGYNLDLTYITPRIIAMAFPASGIEKLYRNNIDTIAELLQTEHNGKYMTVNISGRPIDQTVLKNVVSYQWEDHKAPPFGMLFTICDQVAQFLSEDSERIAVFHCNHGKGRTGTIICCFFLYMGVFTNYQEVIKFYAEKRFEKDGQGVTQPCQIQYIRYFQTYLNNPHLYPRVLYIKKITLKEYSEISDPCFQITSMPTNQVVYNTIEIDSVLELQKSNEYIIKFNNKHFFAGDVTIQLREVGVLANNLLISYIFNTAFVNYQKVLTISLKDLSPLDKQKQSIFGQKFEIDIEFRRFCECGSVQNLSQCQRCHGALKEEAKSWQKIKLAIQVKDQPLSIVSCTFRWVRLFAMETQQIFLYECGPFSNLFSLLTDILIL